MQVKFKKRSGTLSTLPHIFSLTRMIRDEASRGIFKNSSAFLCDPRRNDYIIKREISRNKPENDNKAMQRRKEKNVS